MPGKVRYACIVQAKFYLKLWINFTRDTSKWSILFEVFLKAYKLEYRYSSKSPPDGDACSNSSVAYHG